MRGSFPTPIVFFRLGEPSIRWPGLLRYEQEIQSVTSLLGTPDCTWYEDRLVFIDRINDAAISEELPYGSNCITLNDGLLLNLIAVTIRRKPSIISDGTETSCLHSIGETRTLTLGTLLSRRVRIQKAIIRELVEHHHHSVIGIAEQTRNGKIDSARCRLRSANS